MGAIRVRGLDHVVLRVADLDRAMRFYRDVLGCREERRSEEFGLVQLRAGAAMVDLVTLDGKLGTQGGAGPGAEGRNLEHFCLNIDPFDEASIVRHLQDSGVATQDVETRYGADGFGPSMYISDPDGNTVELKGPPERGPLTADDNQ